MIEEDKIREFVQNQEKGETETPNKQVGPPITETDKSKLPWQKSEEQISLGNQIGWEKINMKDLPTQGFFYPEGTEIAIRSATTGEIRHWSSLNEEDISALDDMINYIIERCCTIKFPGNKFSSWKDIKEVDRFYILLAIRERTFVKGENVLQVKISETKKIDVTKDMVDYITFDDRLMRYYDPEKRCFSLKFKTGKVLNVYLPSVGVTNWLKNYIIRKQNQMEAFDKDFINFAPFVIPDWRGLNDSSYEKFVYESQNWSNAEISMLTEIRKIFADTINPVIKYRDEQGGERSIPLNFQGGIKSILLISDPFSELA
ncbi:MAG TPA: hypothetical protein P5513_04870 [Candidatus Diapherotrites archaeon]|nr:hypothetical protein [Candidatus Diapherotrites archaeon]